MLGWNLTGPRGFKLDILEQEDDEVEKEEV
jgi:hypothetical protein